MVEWINFECTYGVPDLQFDDLVVYSEAEGAEFDTDRNLMLSLELIIHNPLHEARLANARITYDDKFE